MGYKVKIFSIGKHKKTWLETGLKEYEKRLTANMKIEWHFFKKDEDLEKALLKEKTYHCLDPNGKMYTSEEFSSFVLSSSSTSFVIGGPLGLPDKIKAPAATLIGLSHMTFSHQNVRLILLEQLYRAVEISKGSEYHK